MFTLKEMSDVYFLESQNWVRWRRDPFRSGQTMHLFPFPDHDLLLCPYEDTGFIPDGVILGFVAPDIFGHYEDNIFVTGAESIAQIKARINFLNPNQKVGDNVKIQDELYQNWQRQVCSRLACGYEVRVGKGQVSVHPNDMTLKVSKKLSNVGLFVQNNVVMTFKKDNKQHRLITEPFESSCIL